jgi:hypothetical protein
MVKSNDCGNSRVGLSRGELAVQPLQHGLDEAELLQIR